MHMLGRRLQILIDEARYRRLRERARRRKVSVATIIREAIDAADIDPRARADAGRAILAAPKMPVPPLVELKGELDEIRAGAKD
jgi:hypothetical protein